MSVSFRMQAVKIIVMMIAVLVVNTATALSSGENKRLK